MRPHETAHEITLTVLYKLYLEALRKEQPSLFVGPCGSVYVLLRDLEQAFKSDSEEVKSENDDIVSFIKNVGFLRAMRQFEYNHHANKMAQILIYMRI